MNDREYFDGRTDKEIEDMIQRLADNQKARYAAYREIKGYGRRYALWLASSWPMWEWEEP